MTKALRQPDDLDITRPSPARIYDYMLRGRHHFEADVDAAERILSVVPEIRDCAWSNRGFHQRAAAWIAKQGVKQFLDIGSGLPTVGNTHEVVRKIHPDARVVYVDNDPMVELHSEGILDATGRVSVLVGHSGVGKSTLVNALAGAVLMATGAIREDDARGRHTTSHRELSPLPGGALIIDTPGLRELGLIDADEGLGAAFEDIEALIAECRFNDCGHTGEPGCAVRAALDEGTLDRGRWSNFQKLQRELSHHERKEDRLAREAERKRWIAVNKAQRSHRKQKAWD